MTQDPEDRRFCCETLSKSECSHDTRLIISGSDMFGNYDDERRSSVNTAGLVSCDLEIFNDALFALGVRLEAFDGKQKLSSIELSDSSKPPNSDFCIGRNTQSIFY